MCYTVGLFFRSFFLLFIRQRRPKLNIQWQSVGLNLFHVIYSAQSIVYIDTFQNKSLHNCHFLRPWNEVMMTFKCWIILLIFIIKIIFNLHDKTKLSSLMKPFFHKQTIPFLTKFNLQKCLATKKQKMLWKFCHDKSLAVRNKNSVTKKNITWKIKIVAPLKKLWHEIKNNTIYMYVMSKKNWHDTCGPPNNSTFKLIYHSSR